MYKKTKYSTQNTWIIKFKLEACTLLYMLLSMSMYYICTFIPLTPLLIPLSVRLKHPSLSPDRESAPHCKTIALGWYISITLVITYHVIHKTYDSYAKLKNSLYWNWRPWRGFVYLNTSHSNICCIACVKIWARWTTFLLVLKLHVFVGNVFKISVHVNCPSLYKHRKTYGFENWFVWLIINPVSERKVDSIIFTLARSNVL